MSLVILRQRDSNPGYLRCKCHRGGCLDHSAIQQFSICESYSIGRSLNLPFGSTKYLSPLNC